MNFRSSKKLIETASEGHLQRLVQAELVPPLLDRRVRCVATGLNMMHGLSHIRLCF